MEGLLVHIEGIGWWSPGVPNWNAAAALLRDGTTLPTTGDKGPAPDVLPPSERRRAPAPVLLACEVANQACTMAGRDAADVPAVFASAHGDIAISDALCTTLAGDPLALSPTRFHNSVHNAPAGYWTIATHCHAASSAISAWRGSFAAGLLEASVQALADRTPVVFAAYDIAGQGALGDVLPAAMTFGTALLLSPEHRPRTRASLRLRHEARSAPVDEPEAEWRALAEATPIANALPLFGALARAQSGIVRLPNGRASTLAIEVLA
ncbi:beta-ketoacyl synthase chain length factor [Dokdonella soli]|uniref:Beta-ketoacyl synthase chain length factor n=1 Tax=Dokdonella soli TaxID=529810 RepID=A0ABN1IH34_9GAMM